MIEFSRKTIAHIRHTFAHNHYTEHFPEDVLKFIYENKLFKIFIPKTFNGLEAELGEGLETVEMCSYIDGDFGWAVQIGSGGGYFAGFFQEDMAKQHVSHEQFVIAGSGSPTGKAVKKTTTFTSMENGNIVVGVTMLPYLPPIACYPQQKKSRPLHFYPIRWPLQTTGKLMVWKIPFHTA